MWPVSAVHVKTCMPLICPNVIVYTECLRMCVPYNQLCGLTLVVANNMLQKASITNKKKKSTNGLNMSTIP